MSAPDYHSSSKRKQDDPDADLRRKRTVVESTPMVEKCESSSQSNGGSKMDVQFFVRMITSDLKTLVLQGNLSDTVEMVHRKIHSISKIPLKDQRLIYNGKQLQWEQTLEECSIQNDAGLQLVGRMRSTGHPRAWRVINDMVSIIRMLCRSELPSNSCTDVKEKLESFIALPIYKQDNNLASLLFKYNTRTVNSYEPKETTSDEDNAEDDEDEDEDGEEGEKEEEVNEDSVGCGNINQIDYCKIFMDACAPQGLVMLYMSAEKCNQECAEGCIRAFVGFMNSLGGRAIDRTYSAAVVMEFCRLLRMMGVKDNVLYLYCRTILGSMLKNIEVISGSKDIYRTSCIGIKDMFLFVMEVGWQLVKDLTPSAKYNVRIENLIRNVCDFSAFLQPVLAFVRRGPSLDAAVQKGKGEVSPLEGEVHNLFPLFNELLGQIDKGLSKIDMKNINEFDFGVYQSARSQYIAILKELSSISMLYPGFEEQILTVMRHNKAALSYLIVRYVNRANDHSWLRKYKDVLDFESRRYLAMLLFPESRENYEELHEMLIDRSQLLAESFEYISRARPSWLHSGIFMEFKNEEATGPGVLREWFFLVCQAIFDPQNALFAACPLDRRRFFPNPASKVDPLHLRYFHFSGRVIALALMYKIQVGVLLDRVFFLQLAGRPVALEDIQDADPCMFNSCKQILEMDAEFVDSDGLGLTFVTEVEDLGSRQVVELCSGGKGIIVNSQNRKEYVNLIIQHHFVRSITEQVSSFAQGFADILKRDKRRENCRERFFQCLELTDLDMMLHGFGNEISVKDWKAHTDYDGYQESDAEIVWFWEVLSLLNAEQKKTLLFFWTSVKYLPIEGFHGLASRLFIHKSSESQDRLPSSHTCFYRLCIPLYPSKAVMEERFRVITQEHIGCSFGIW